MHKIKLEFAASKGICFGKACWVKQRLVTINRTPVADQQKIEESDRFRKALQKTEEAIEYLVELNDIFTAHLEILRDEILKDNVLIKINKENKNAETALDETCSELLEMFNNIEDEYLRERRADLKDVCERILRNLTDINDDIPGDCKEEEIIVIADEISPSQTALLDLNKVKGFITRTGGNTSHVSIIARNNSIPAFVGVGDLVDKIGQDDLIILDAINNEIIINPSNAVLASKKNAANVYYSHIIIKNNFTTKTADGIEIGIYANAENPEDINHALSKGFDGIGLFRSEFFFMNQADTFPDEESQYIFFKNVAKLCGTKKVVIRTFDIGGDKPIPYLITGKESNPFMGLRGIRVSLALLKVFKTHLRAILRASAYGNIKIMFPMIVSIEEFVTAKQMLHDCMKELTIENKAFNKNIETGVMIETPAAVMIVDELAEEAAFFSIGTNDLTQYMLAVDRGNPLVSAMFDTFHPAVLRSIKKIVAAAENSGINVSICGEIASDERALPVLLGLGLKEFSIGINEINSVTNIINAKKYCELRKLTEELLNKSLIRDIKDLIDLM